MENTERRAVAWTVQIRSRRAQSSPACRHGWQPGCGAQLAEYVQFTLVAITPALGAVAQLIVKWTRILEQDKVQEAEIGTNLKSARKRAIPEKQESAYWADSKWKIDMLYII
jgi:hypothetical protein